METIFIDINCDMGEGVGNEAALLPLISSCNIACGGHAGDEHTIRSVTKLANHHNVKVGAHPSYPDRKGFGRISMDIPFTKLRESLNGQLETFVQILQDENIPLNHIKPHGALYNDVVKNLELAKVFLKVVEKYKEDILIYVPYGSKIAYEAQEQGFKIYYEAFGDRNYNDDLSLVSRKKANALVEAPEMVANHILGMAKNNSVKTTSGKNVKILADTFCIHGDTPSALQILMYLDRELPNHQVQLRK